MPKMPECGGVDMFVSKVVQLWEADGMYTVEKGNDGRRA